MARPASRVLYHCPCHLGVISDHEGGPFSDGEGAGEPHLFAGASPSSNRIPAVPSRVPEARYAYHPLSLLYFCTDCLSARCSLCSVAEIVTHYCPSCLFEVPSASVKADRNRCPRNCFICPTRGCGSYLSVIPTDPDLDALGGKLESGEASIGRPPYFLSCLRCKWDSKKGFKDGYVFEKPTGISAQLDAQRGTFVGQSEMDSLRSHFEGFLRKQQQQQQQTQLLQRQNQTGQQHSAGKLPSLPSSLSKSKLFRDIPGVTDPSKYLTGSRRAGAAALGLAQQKGAVTKIDDQPPPYTSKYAPSSYARIRGKDGDTRASQADQMGVMGRREEGLRDAMRDLDSGKSSFSLDLSNPNLMWERYQSGWDAGPLTVPNPSLEPLRVPLETKKTHRCPACRHILVKPDAKATSHRWKIKLSAMSYLPEIHASFKEMRGPKMLRGAMDNPSVMSDLRRRTSTLNIRSQFPAGGMPAAGEDRRVVVENSALQRGRTYDYELSFKNPLEDVISIHLALFSPTRKRRHSSHAGSQPPQRATPKAPWQVRASATRFTVKPFDDVDAVIDDDLLDDPRTRTASSKTESFLFPEEDEVDDFEDVANDGQERSEAPEDPSQRGKRQSETSHLRPGLRHQTQSGKSGRDSSGLGRGIVRQRGNETVIALRAIIDPVASGDDASVEESPNDQEILDIEIALRVTFTYRLEEGGEGDDRRTVERAQGPNEGDPAEGRSADSDRSISFLAAIYLGRVEAPPPLAASPKQSLGGSSTVDTARRPNMYVSETSVGGAQSRDFSTAPEIDIHVEGGVSETFGDAHRGGPHKPSPDGHQPAALPPSTTPTGATEDQAARLDRLRKRRSEMFSAYPR
ncbi:unnamed protein product [Parajaminaea phylloscopi]